MPRDPSKDPPKTPSKDSSKTPSDDRARDPRHDPLREPIPTELVADDLRTVDADAVVVGLFEGVREPGGAAAALDGALDGALAEALELGDHRGRLGELLVLYGRGRVAARRALVIGLGPREAFDAEAARRAAAAAARRARALGVRTLATVLHGAGAGGLEPAAAAQAAAEGTLLALHRTPDWRSSPPADPDRDVARLLLVEPDAARREAAAAGLRAARAIAAGVGLARDLVTMPPNVATPTRLAEVARDLAAAHGLRVHVGDRAWAEAQGMGAFLAVAQGTSEPPAFVVLEHHADRTDGPTVALVGKGVTYDSGGLTLKTRDGLITMKSDMAGAAAVLGAMRAAVGLELPLRLVALLPCVQNMPDGAAYRPSDVVRAGNGKTIEIISTDAEGRLALADALHHAARWEPAATIDVATLTGACVTALGKGVAAGLFADDDALAARLERAASATGERVWRLPLFPEYRRAIDTDVADMKNTGGKQGGVGTSAALLQEFAPTPWAHLDIAGLALRDGEGPYGPKGATGYGVRLLVEALRGWSG